jgi:TetR/AcrR family transcriptional repressor of nem operon
MRITKDQAAENRERVIDEAAKLFRQRGFDAVGVAELMRAAGLTHGGFYNHFPSKDALEAAACERIFSRSIANLEAIAEVAEPATRRRAFSSYAENYVSAENRDALAPRCPMIAFAGDVPRQSAEVRDAYAEGLRAYLDALARASDQSDPDVNMLSSNTRNGSARLPSRAASPRRTRNCRMKSCARRAFRSARSPTPAGRNPAPCGESRGDS